MKQEGLDLLEIIGYGTGKVIPGSSIHSDKQIGYCFFKSKSKSLVFNIYSYSVFSFTLE